MAKTKRPSTLATSQDGAVLTDMEARNSELSVEVLALRRKLMSITAYAFRLREVSHKPASLVREAAWFVEAVKKLGVKNGIKRFLAYRLIKHTNLFDADLYCDCINLQMKPAAALWHYVITGFENGGDPCPGFNTRRYLEYNQDIREAGIEPLSHFLLHGRRERRLVWPSDFAISRMEAFVANNKIKSFATGEDALAQWPMAGRADQKPKNLSPFDVRPDDPVLVAADLGETYLGRHKLLSARPDYKGAITALNAIARSVPSRPQVSIVIPVYGELAWTLNCLNALLQHESRYSFEILIGDDASTDETGKWLPLVKGISYIGYDDNEGFIANCNKTVANADGDFVVLLNNDTCVVDGWLDVLIDSFKTFPKAGLVGSKLFYPDGRLQEAGGIVWRDASAWNYGRNDDPNRPQYSYARKADYISGCSIALRKKVWDDMGGFDSHFAPAYYEDVDLCFRLRAAGLETWFQPMSRIIHYEGRTSGTNTAQGIKSYQIDNQKKLLTRWKDTLATHRANGEDPWLERDRNTNKRTLIIDATNPTPWMDAGSIAVMNLFRYYQANGYQVSFAPDNLLYERRANSSMAAMGVQAFYSPYYQSIAEILRIYGVFYDAVHVIRAEPAGRHYEAIRTFAPHAKAIFQNCDLHYLRMERQANIENKPQLLAEAQAMKVKELRLSRNYDLTITHSEAEKVILNAELPDRDIMVMPLIESAVTVSVDFDARKDLMFLGGYGHPPNVDAALWLIDEIWPRLEEALPGARLLIVGANPTDAIKARAGDRIIVTGLVDDLSPWFAQTRLFLAALRYGAGSKGKVLTALAHGVPVILTDVAVEGLPLENGENAYIANSADEIVAATLKLYAVPEATWNRHSAKAQAYIGKHHTLAAGIDLLNVALARSVHPSR